MCINCMKRKQNHDSIPKKSQRKTQKLQLVHANICGLITPASNSNKRYILYFIYDYSRKTCIYFLS